MTIRKLTKYLGEDGFEFTFEPIEESITITKTNEGYQVRYLTPDESSEPPSVWADDNLFLVHYHRSFQVEHKSIICEDDLKEIFQSKEEDHQEGDTIHDEYHVFPVSSYIHSGVRLSLGDGFRGRLPEGHYRFDVSFCGAVFVSKNEWPNYEDAERAAVNLVSTWNMYLSGDVYLAVKETYYKDKEPINYDCHGGIYGYDSALANLKENELF